MSGRTVPAIYLCGGDGRLVIPNLDCALAAWLEEATEALMWTERQCSKGRITMEYIHKHYAAPLAFAHLILEQV